MGNEIFAQRMKKLRQDKKMTMDDLAKKLDVSKSRVNMWENNGSVPRKDTLLAISSFFNVTTDYLLGNDSNKVEENSKLHILQRGLSRLNDDDLTTAEQMLKAVFKNIFEDDEDEKDGI